MKYGCVYTTELGKLCILQEEEWITGLGFYDAESCKDTAWQETPLLRQAICEIREYLAGHRKVFTIPLRTSGTPFQEKVWQVLREIPYGETRTYGWIGESAGSPKGARAVGMACHSNPIMIVIPCHRVIGANGSLTGFGGGLEVKKRLLSLEVKTR